MLIYEKGKPTPLLYGTLSPESVRARTDALVLVGIYADRLWELAGNNSPQAFRKNSFKLGENLDDLSKTFTELSSSDIDAMQYSGPVSKIIGLLGEMYMETSREQIIKQAIKVGAPAVNKILNQLQSDLNDVIVPLQTTGIRQKLSEMSVYYNDNRKKLTLTRRKAELSRINRVVKEYNNLINSNPANLIQEMKQANNALAKYAESSGTPQDLAQFVSVLERFNGNVKIFAAIIDKI